MKENALIPVPIIDEKEASSLVKLQKRYEKLTSQNMLLKAGTKAASLMPERIKDIGKGAKTMISETEFIQQALKCAIVGFKTLNEMAAKVTVNEKNVIKKVNATIAPVEISALEEVCLVRAYDISGIVNKEKFSNTLAATLEGLGTGAMGFAGLIPNLVASTFLYFRAVQSIAMYYGYNVKESAEEMEIASAVLMSAINPRNDAINNELTATIGKFMIFTETTVVKETSKKTWTAMAEHGGLSLLITQIRALANQAAKKALENAGKKGLEQTVFKNILEQLGKSATLKTTGKAMPLVGGIFGALFDTAQMKKILDYADIFYNKRFVEEKEARINSLFGFDNESKYDISDVEFKEFC